MAAVGALIEMAAQRGGAATLNRRQHFEMLPAEPVATRLDETLSGGADQIGHFQRGTLHELLSATPPYPIRPMMLTWSHAKRLPSGFVQILLPPTIVDAKGLGRLSKQTETESAQGPGPEKIGLLVVMKRVVSEAPGR